MSTFRTYNNQDDTSTGWDVTSGVKRTVATYRTRWQGSRNAIKLTIYDAGELLAKCEADADEDYSVSMMLDMELDAIASALGHNDSLRTGHAETFNGWLVRVTSAGHTVA